MGRVHPNPDAGGAPEHAASASTSSSTSRATTGEEEVRAGGGEEPAVSLTVWRKSLLFGCDGFTVFDARGDLAFRVDCYASSRRRADVVLMGAAGEPLLTVRRARRLGGLLASERWFIYDGDGATPVLSVRSTRPGVVQESAGARDAPRGRRLRRRCQI